MMSRNIDTDYSFADMYIGSDERVLWKGRPEKGITFTPNELATIPFGIFFTAFSIFSSLLTSFVIISSLIIISLYGK